MISRYTREEIGRIWSEDNKFLNLLEVEKVVAQTQADLGIIPKSAALAISERASYDLVKIREIEKKTRHDVAAFVMNVTESVGKEGRFFHFGLTSSDVLDTGLSLTLKQSKDVVFKGFEALESELLTQAKKHKETLCSGRTHGVHAEPTTFGLKLLGHLCELRRNKARFQKSVAQALIVKLSGAVGTYSSQPPEVERRVAEVLGLTPESIATQVVPRDRHAEVIYALCSTLCGLERLAIELRHLQRTEVGEVFEEFKEGQKGSSVMPHKKNPISAENISGLARLLRGYCLSAFENISLWHERDISHSSVERVIFPDAFILTDYALDRMSHLVKNLTVDKEQMKKNMDISRGRLFSSQVLLKLVEKGLTREEAYTLVQKAALGNSNKNLKEVLMKTEQGKLLNSAEWEQIFTGEIHKKRISELFDRRLKEDIY